MREDEMTSGVFELRLWADRQLEWKALLAYFSMPEKSRSTE